MIRHFILTVGVLWLVVPAFAQRQDVTPLLPADTFKIAQFKERAESLKDRDLKEQSRCYDQIALIYWEHNICEKAVEWYQKSIAVNKKLDNLSGISMINTNLGLIYNDMHQFKLAYECFQQTLAYRKMMKDKHGSISPLINMSVALNDMLRFDESIAALNEALSLARELNDIEQMQSCYGMLSETYEKAKQPEKAHEYFQYYRTFYHAVQTEKAEAAEKKVSEAELKVQLAEIEKQNKDLQLQLAARELTEKKEELSESQNQNVSLYNKYTKAELERAAVEKDNLLKEKDIEAQRIQHERQRLSIFLLTGFLILVGVALVIVIRLYRQKYKMNQQLQEQNSLISYQKEEIEKHQADLTASINYALRIQSAALKKTMSVNLRSLIDDFFVFFRSSAIVSGDFYWFSIVEGKLIIVGADCTGHGVPGAFMSFIGMNLLNKIVESDRTYMPDEILLKLNYAIIETLDQKKNNSFDGMDVAICMLDFEAGKLHFAGAYRPMLIYKPGEGITLVKGNIGSLGGSQELFERTGMFTLKEFDLAPAMRFYIFSDGFADQINDDFKKFGSKRFYRLIEQTASLPMKDQCTAISDFFEDWKGATDQVDDAMVLGFSLKP
ncbi:MAG: SpoIIE family protein phosphatase [Bacteroidales bacterium]|nr:SpoIIE family protein phosphatase [Bacteroidales bacterium]